MNEKRKAKRFDLKLPVTLSAKDLDLVRLQTSDISSQGVFIMTNVPIHASSNVYISIYLPAMHASTGELRCMLKTNGRVIRTERNVIAVQFDRACKISPFTNNNKTH